MKKSVIFLSLLLIFGVLFFCYVKADAPSAPVSDSDLQKIQNITNQIPIDDSGGLDQNKVVGWKTQAELRIDAINQWLKDNASWLSIVFGMVPEISWLFALNLYIMLFFFTMVLNGRILSIPIMILGVFFPFIPNSFIVGGNLDRQLSSKTLSASRIILLVVFIVLLYKKSFLWLANIVMGWFSWIWNWVLPYGTIAIIVFAIIFVVILILIAIYAPGLLVKIDEIVKKWEEKKAKKAEDANRKRLAEDVEVAEAFTKELTKK
jgi:hypothetical protein